VSNQGAVGITTKQAQEFVSGLLQYLGEDVSREGLIETPYRVVKALKEMTWGYGADPKEILGKIFRTEYDEMVVVKDIPFVSLCEHHLMPFFGTASVAYIPSEGKVVGLSKIPRVVHALAARLQLQERLTQEIADAIDNPNLAPHGVAVVIRAVHSCMRFRGAKSQGEMVTSCLRGAFKDNPATREEFLRLMGMK